MFQSFTWLIKIFFLVFSHLYCVSSNTDNVQFCVLRTNPHQMNNDNVQFCVPRTKPHQMNTGRQYECFNINLSHEHIHTVMECSFKRMSLTNGTIVRWLEWPALRITNVNHGSTEYWSSKCESWTWKVHFNTEHWIQCTQRCSSVGHETWDTWLLHQSVLQQSTVVQCEVSSAAGQSHTSLECSGRQVSDQSLCSTNVGNVNQGMYTCWRCLFLRCERMTDEQLWENYSLTAVWESAMKSCGSARDEQL